ncbi:hypothetical protein TH30_20110 [Thalassospira profundimaris]|uniref:Uncharacterized protein n=1 Tax=Thalassospira profundimaris TaxID=502049 RepID=A0A367WNI5_9PROT|nr:hypothetical protein TH30_20110 [Thalassospira profundimaris]
MSVFVATFDENVNRTIMFMARVYNKIIAGQPASHELMQNQLIAAWTATVFCRTNQATELPADARPPGAATS